MIEAQSENALCFFFTLLLQLVISYVCVMRAKLIQQKDSYVNPCWQALKTELIYTQAGLIWTAEVRHVGMAISGSCLCVSKLSRRMAFSSHNTGQNNFRGRLYVIHSAEQTLESLNQCLRRQEA